MKRNVALALLLSLINMSAFLSSFSQGNMDYQTVLPDIIPFFHAPSGPLESSVRAIRIDSVSQVGTDLELFPYHEPYYSGVPSYYCVTPFGPSWLGFKIIIKTNGDNLFLIQRNLNSQNVIDTVLIKTHALAGESWVFFSDEYYDSTLTATVTYVDTMSFLGVTDSVKYISLSSGIELILSKDHGFIRTLMLQDQYLYSSSTLFSLIGSTELGGIDFLTIGEVYDYEIGDIFHIWKFFGNFYAPDFYYVQEVIDKYFSEEHDTVFYLMNQYYWCEGGDPPCSFFEIDTILNYYQNLDQPVENGYLPFESEIEDYGGDGILSNHMMGWDSSAFNGREFLGYPESCFHRISDTCYTQCESIAYSQSFIRGAGSRESILGGSVGGECEPCSFLVYYLKGEEEWGTPLIIPLGIGETEADLAAFDIYPNPADHSIKIHTDSKNVEDHAYELKIYDARGYEVFAVKGIPGVEHEISTASYPPGIYLMILWAGSNINTQRFIILH